MTSFIAIYRGESIKTAKLVAVTADPILVTNVARVALRETGNHAVSATDPVLAAVDRGKRAALRIIEKEGVHHAEASA